MKNRSCIVNWRNRPLQVIDNAVAAGKRFHNVAGLLWFRCDSSQTSLLHGVSKKYTPWCLIITFANVDRFSNFFHRLIRKKILYDISQRFPLHLQYAATLPCEIRKSKMLLILAASSTDCWHVPEDTVRTWL